MYSCFPLRYVNVFQFFIQFFISTFEPSYKILNIFLCIFPCSRLFFICECDVTIICSEVIINQHTQHCFCLFFILLFLCFWCDAFPFHTFAISSICSRGMIIKYLYHIFRYDLLTLPHRNYSPWSIC